MTVRELRKVLAGSETNLVIAVWYGPEEYDIATDSPVRSAFDDYVVDEVMAFKENHFNIYLKQKYVKEGDHEEN